MTLDLLAQSSDAAAGGILFGFGIIGLLIGLVALALFLWALIDCIGNTSLDGTMKIVWILVILFTSPIGAILYLILGRGNRAGV